MKASAGDRQGSRWVVLGRVSGLFGVRGWIRVFSYTDPRDRILAYPRWYLGPAAEGTGGRPVEVLGGRVHGKGILARLAGCEDRDAAAALIGLDIAVRREDLPPLAAGEYYWSDLEGLRVTTRDGAELGRVRRLFDTGANDVMVVDDGERERLIPFIQGRVVTRIDLDAARMEVDWDPDF